MVVVAQLVERQIVILNVAGSSPVDHPMATARLVAKAQWLLSNAKEFTL
jgi:hypothetical protein